MHLLLSVENARARAVQEALRSNEGVLLVRVQGGAPAPAIDVFARMKAPMADDARTLAFVPSEGGHPSAPPSELDWLTISVWGWIGTACVLLVCGFYAFMPQLERRAARQRARRSAPPR
ncbi:MAG: hypothetical protein ABI330_04335 [Caldimonas sp.]